MLAILAVYLLLQRKVFVELSKYVPDNAAFACKFQSKKLSETEIQTLAQYGFPPKMLKQLMGNELHPGPLFNQPMLFFGEQTPAGPALGLLFAPKDLSEFNSILQETRYTGTTINESNGIRFLEFSTGLYLAWTDELALLSFQLSAGDTYPMALFNNKNKASGSFEKLKSDSVQCMLKPAAVLQMLNYEKPSSVLTALAGFIPQKTTLFGKLNKQTDRLLMDLDVTDGATELNALLKPAPGGEICADESKTEKYGSLIYLALQKQALGSIAALTGQSGNPLLSKLNGNACLWLPENNNNTEQPWLLWLGAEFTQNEKILLQQSSSGVGVSSLPGLNITLSGNCLLLSPKGQTIADHGYKIPKHPMAIHLRSHETSLSLLGNSRTMQLKLEFQANQSPLLWFLKALGQSNVSETTP